MIKLPSFQSLWVGFKTTFKRFPLQMLIAVFATVVSFVLIDTTYDEFRLQSILYRLLYVSNIGITLTLAGDLFAETNSFKPIRRWLLRIAALAICIGVYFSINPNNNTADFYRICLLIFAFHLLVAFAPFVFRGNINGFWQYNKSLFLRFLTSVLYSGALYAGLAIAILSVDKLFNTRIDGDTYGYLFALIGITFQTCFFLAGIPRDFNVLKTDTSFPKGLKIFTQYVLIPLMTIYLCILLAYEIKIALSWQLPKGFVSTLILGYSVFGILSLLLIFPIREQEGNNWMKFFSKFFYVMMVPLIVLLILSVSKRVSVYGITESRYILVVLALWLSGITIYFLVSKQQNIKVIPVSLTLLALLIIYGPQSAFSISKYSQISRLRKLMDSRKPKDIGERSEVIRYLVKNHGITALQSFTKTDLAQVEQHFLSKNLKNRWDYKYDLTDTAFKILNVKEYDADERTEYFYFKSENDKLLDVSGFEAAIPFSNNDYEQRNTKFSFNGDSVQVYLTDAKGGFNGTVDYLRFKVNNTTSTAVSLKPLIIHKYQLVKQDKLKRLNNQNYVVPDQQMQGYIADQKYIVKYVIASFSSNFKRNDSTYGYLNLNGTILIKRK